MHRLARLSCQKAKRVPLVTSRCIALKGAGHRTTIGCILRGSAFILADKNNIVIPGTFINRTVCNALLNDLKINATSEKILGHLVTVFIPGWQKKHLGFLFGCRNRRRTPTFGNTCQSFHGFYKAVFLDFDQIVQGRNTAKTS